MDVPGVERHISEFVLGLIGTGDMAERPRGEARRNAAGRRVSRGDSGAVVLERLCGTIARVR
jgi:hypothetical protein